MLVGSLTMLIIVQHSFFHRAQLRRKIQNSAATHLVAALIFLLCLFIVLKNAAVHKTQT